MSDIVDSAQIEQIVGVSRHADKHFGRAVSADRTVYILHSQDCKDSGRDLRECPFSLAMDKGIDNDTATYASASGSAGAAGRSFGAVLCPNWQS